MRKERGGRVNSKRGPYRGSTTAAIQVENMDNLFRSLNIPPKDAVQPQESLELSRENEIKDPQRETLLAIVSLNLHQGFSINNPEDYEKYSHGDIVFGMQIIRPVKIWVGTKEEYPFKDENDEWPKRMIFIPKIGKDTSDKDIQVEFIKQFAALGEAERFLLFNRGYNPFSETE